MTFLEFLDTDGDKIWFQVQCRNMNYYVNGKIKVNWLTSMRFDGNTIHLDGTSAGSWGSARMTTAPSSDAVTKVKSWWSSLQKNEMFGFVDTDGDPVAFQLNGRYLNYWVRDAIKVKDLSKLTLQDRTFHLDGTSTGSHSSARFTTFYEQSGATLDELDLVIQLFKRRPSRGLMCIGSAGHGSGTAKALPITKDAVGTLDTKDDIEDCKRYVVRHSSFYQFFGSYEVAGLTGSADGCKAELRKFFEYCKAKKIPPIVYYTGHGDSDGDWCFPNGGYISYEQLVALNVSGWKMEIWSDCCYAGQWASKAKGRSRVIAAANRNTTARDRVFARAVFNNSKEDQDRLWASDINAISADFDCTCTSYFRGDSGPGIKG